MLLLFKIGLLVVLVKLLINFEKPVLCSTLFALGSFLLFLAGGTSFGTAFVLTLAEFGIATLMFVLMNRSEGTAWWAILIVGTFLLGWV